MSMIEEVAAMKQEQEAQRGDLVRINNSINELTKALQGTTAAIGNLSDKCDRLMIGLQAVSASSQDSLTKEQVRNIIAEELKDIQQEGANVFASLRDKAAKLCQEFDVAGNVASKKIREAGKPDWLEVAVRTLFIAFWYILITCGIMRWVYGINDIHKELNYLHNRVDVIQYNQTIDGAKFTPWDMKAFYEAWDNQNKHIWEQRNKKAQ
ncbi:hypothetical protein [Selenomonas ruminis]|uniref:Uncharacterized protein n=1 Tax=Selenomonas ruminis TaxID=2593411 RepID=A0A5D6VUB6_9FIRM|nr:hypothetical protein [Selenomonas sp. mPRGC5]TYZ19266.1 hypothetical protein FZ040_13595 [Selenomonas sp. mPRGC5]